MNNSLPKILWIDDEIDLLRPHILLLEEKGYDVAITTTGKEGLGLIKDQNFDLVLIDQFMPGDDGIETSVNIKSVNPSVPIRAPGSARMTSPSIPKLAVTPPVVGSVNMGIYRPPSL